MQNFPVLISILTTTSSLISIITQEIMSLNINIGFNQQFFPNTSQVNTFKNIKLTNEQLTKIIYDNYNKTSNITFTYEQYVNETKKGLNNIERVRAAVISTYEEKIWVRNNFRIYNFNLVNWYNEYFHSKTRFLYCDYIINNMFFERNIWSFNNDGKIDIKFLFNRNYLPYKLYPSYLKTILFDKNCSFII